MTMPLRFLYYRLLSARRRRHTPPAFMLLEVIDEMKSARMRKREAQKADAQRRDIKRAIARDVNSMGQPGQQSAASRDYAAASCDDML